MSAGLMKNLRSGHLLHFLDSQHVRPASRAGRCFRMRQPIAASRIQRGRVRVCAAWHRRSAAGIHYGYAAAIRQSRVRHHAGM